MADHEPLLGIAQDESLHDMLVDIDDILMKAMLRKLIQLKFDASSNLNVVLTSLPTLATLTTLTTMTTGNIGIGDAGKQVSYQQISAIATRDCRSLFVWE